MVMNISAMEKVFVTPSAWTAGHNKGLLEERTNVHGSPLSTAGQCSNGRTGLETKEMPTPWARAATA